MCWFWGLFELQRRLIQWLCIVLDDLIFQPSTGKHHVLSHGINKVAAVPSFKSKAHHLGKSPFFFPIISIKVMWPSLNQWLWLGLCAALVSFCYGEPTPGAVSLISFSWDIYLSLVLISYSIISYHSRPGLLVSCLVTFWEFPSWIQWYLFSIQFI